MRSRWIPFGLAVVAIAFAAWPALSQPRSLVAPVDPEPLHTRMHEHFASLREIHRALLFGDLKKARRIARGLSEMTAPGGLPGWESAVARIRQTAARLTAAKSAKRARRLVADLAVQCGDCHEDNADVSRFVGDAEPFDDGSSAGRMARHEWAAGTVWLGLIGPSPDLWRDGLSALAAPPLLPEAFTDDRALHQKVDALSRRMAALAARARLLDDSNDEAQAAAFADLLEVCAGCHQLTR
jgi:cytochrome c553